MNKWASLATGQNGVLLKEKLDELGKRRQDIEAGIQTLEQMIDEIQRESVSQELVILALNKFTPLEIMPRCSAAGLDFRIIPAGFNAPLEFLTGFTDVFDHIQPYQQKELLRLVPYKAVLAPDSIKIALYGRPPETGLLSVSESEIHSQMATWLPGQDPAPSGTIPPHAGLIPPTAGLLPVKPS